MVYGSLISNQLSRFELILEDGLVGVDIGALQVAVDDQVAGSDVGVGMQLLAANMQEARK